MRKAPLQLPWRVAPLIPEMYLGGKNTICTHIHIIVVIYWDVYKEAFLKNWLHVAEERYSWLFIRKFHFPKSCLLTLKCCHWFYNLHSHCLWEACVSNDTMKYTVLHKSVAIICQYSIGIFRKKFHFFCYVFSECKVR